MSRKPFHPADGCTDSRFGWIASAATGESSVMLTRPSKSLPFEACQWADDCDSVLSLAIGRSCEGQNPSPAIVGISQRLNSDGPATISLLDPRDSIPRALPTPLSASSSYGSDLVYSQNHWLVCEPTGFTDIPYSGQVWALDASDRSVHDVLVPDSAGPYDMFGNCIDAHSEFVAIGAPLQDQPLLDCGAVHIYRWSGGVLEPLQMLISGAPQTSGWFGSSVQFLDENQLLIGAPGAGQNGLVELYRFDGDRWNFKTRYFAPHSSCFRFGGSISSIGKDLFISEKSMGTSWVHLRRGERQEDRFEYTPVESADHPRLPDPSVLQDSRKRNSHSY